ncbi:unnamed protein product, partial [Pylaiella littoralis]
RALRAGHPLIRGARRDGSGTGTGGGSGGRDGGSDVGATSGGDAVMSLSQGRAETEECRARLRGIEEAAEREVAPLVAAAAESEARADGLEEERRRLQEQLRAVEGRINVERQAREQALAGAREAQAKYEGRRAAEVERLQEWEDVLRYAEECENIPSIICNLRRELEAQLAAAARGAFPGTTAATAAGGGGSAAALGAYTESLQEYLEVEVECVRRLRERARAEGAKMSSVEEELVQYEGLDMPTLTTGLRARMQQLRSDVEEDRAAERAVMSQARHQLAVFRQAFSALDGTRSAGAVTGGDGGGGGVVAVAGGAGGVGVG